MTLHDRWHSLSQMCRFSSVGDNLSNHVDNNTCKRTPPESLRSWIVRLSCSQWAELCLLRLQRGPEPAVCTTATCPEACRRSIFITFSKKPVITQGRAEKNHNKITIAYNLWPLSLVVDLWKLKVPLESRTAPKFICSSIICSLAHYQDVLKKDFMKTPICNIWSYSVHKQTDKDQPSHNLLGGGKYKNMLSLFGLHWVSLMSLAAGEPQGWWGHASQLNRMPCLAEPADTEVSKTSVFRFLNQPSPPACQLLCLPQRISFFRKNTRFGQTL